MLKLYSFLNYNDIEFVVVINKLKINEIVKRERGDYSIN